MAPTSSDASSPHDAAQTEPSAQVEAAAVNSTVDAGTADTVADHTPTHDADAAEAEQVTAEDASADGGSDVTPDATPATATPARKDLSPAEVSQMLKSRWPALFTGISKPLKLRIQVDIQTEAPGVFSRQALSAFFRRYTGSHSYLVGVTRAPHRFDLNGQPAGEITEEHRQAAADELKRRRGLQEERHAEELAQRQRRASLLRDFERTTLSRSNFCTLKNVEEDQLDALLEQARQEAREAPPPAPDRGPRRPDDRGGRPPRQGDRPGGDRPHGRGPQGRGPNDRRPADSRGPDRRGPGSGGRPVGDRPRGDRRPGGPEAQVATAAQAPTRQEAVADNVVSVPVTAPPTESSGT